MRRRREDENGAQEVVELAALADGTLAPERRAALEARVAASSELTERLAEQQRAVTLMRSAAEDIEAPAALRARIEAQRRGRRVRSAASPPRDRSLRGRRAGGRHGAERVRFRAALPSNSAPPLLRLRSFPTPRATRHSPRHRRVGGSSSTPPGLPRLENGRYYQAWLRNTAGVLVPIGTFNEGRKVTLWAGVPPTDFTTLSVTRERADGDQSSSGERVLVGTINTGDSG